MKPNIKKLISKIQFDFGLGICSNRWCAPPLFFPNRSRAWINPLIPAFFRRSLAPIHSPSLRSSPPSIETSREHAVEANFSAPFSLWPGSIGSWRHAAYLHCGGDRITAPYASTPLPSSPAATLSLFPASPLPTGPSPLRRASHSPSGIRRGPPQRPRHLPCSTARTAAPARRPAAPSTRRHQPNRPAPLSSTRRCSPPESAVP